MNILSWNVRGLRNLRTFEALRLVLKKYIVDILFLCETKMVTRQMNRIKWKLNFKNCFTMYRVGSGGGIALLWNYKVDLKITSYSSHHIDALVRTKEGLLWRFTGFYGNPDQAE